MSIASLVATYGYWAVFLIVMLESVGIPLPGETTLVAAALYASATHELNIGIIVASAACGGILGDSIGYWLGRRFGFPLLLRYGPFVGLSESRLKLGEYLFLKFGGRIIFFGRFVAALRMFAALLAGVNKFPWGRFLFFNASGGIVWAATFGFGAYSFWETLQTLSFPLAVIAVVLVLSVVILAWRELKRREKEYSKYAEKALPGRLQPPFKLRR